MQQSTLALVVLTSIVIAAIVIVSIFVPPDNAGQIIEKILLVAGPTLAALYAALRSTQNSVEITRLQNKAEDIHQETLSAKHEAATAKEVAATIKNQVVATKAAVQAITPTVNTIVEEVKQLKTNGHDNQEDKK